MASFDALTTDSFSPADIEVGLRAITWRWIDRFIEFESGVRATAIKRVGYNEGYRQDHFPGWPIMPASLILEGMGQSGMLLSCEAIGYSQLVILAKVPRARFYFDALPGDLLTYDVTLESIEPNGIAVSAVSTVNGRLQASADILFARLAEKTPEETLHSMLELSQVLEVFEVGRTAAGRRLSIPERLARS